ncbi:MAG: FtsX-like permease family protein [Pseudomonadota bacterium]
MKYLTLIFANLRRKKLRTALTVLSIIVAFLLFGYLSAIKTGFTAGVEVAGADRLITRNKVSLINLVPLAHKRDIEAIEGVDLVTHQSWFGGIYQQPTNFFPQFVVEPEPFLDLYPEYVLTEAQKENWLSNRTGVIIGESLVNRFGWKEGDRIPLLSPIWGNVDGTQDWAFDVSAVYEAAEEGVDTSQMFIRYDYFDEATGNIGAVGWYTLRIEDPDQAAEVAADIDRAFANSPDETKTEPEGAFLQGFANQVGNIGFIIGAIVSAVFFTILLVAGNTMAYTVSERTNELAVLKAIGFTDTGVLSLVLGESLVITALGGGLGLLLAWLMVSAGDPTNGALPIFYIPPQDLILGIVLIFALAFVVGIMPARSAMRLQVSDALRR